MTTPAPGPREHLLALLTRLSFELRPVVLASGVPSHFYLDCKQTALHPEGAHLLGQLMLEQVASIEATIGENAVGVGGMTLGADPLATAVSLASRGRPEPLAAFIVRKERKGHGTGAWIEGRRNLPDGAPIVLLEDVLTTGASTARAVEHAIEEGLRPLGVVAIVDRFGGGVERLQAMELEVRVLFTARDFPVGTEG